MSVRLLTFVGMFLVLVSCHCQAPLKITSIQKSDKKLACKDIILEINESEHYRDQAQESRGVSFSKVFMPTCWVSGYIDGSSAVKSADARINYLGNIYDLLDCGGVDQKSPPPPRAKGPAPSPVRVAPQPQPQRQLAPLPPQGYAPSYPPTSYSPSYQKQAAPSFAPYATNSYPAAGATRVPDEQFKKPLPLGQGGKRPYRRVPIDQAHGDAWLHEHTDREGKVYTHSHPHRGPHQHAEDNPAAPAP